MAARQRDVKVRILSEYYDAGSKAAERANRRLASLQMAAAAEDVAREQAKAAAIVKANHEQALAMDKTGKFALGLSAAIAVGLGVAAKAAMDWESAFAGVRKVVDGSPEEISALEVQLRGLAKTLPATHEEIAGVAEVAGQLGVARKDIAAFTETAVNMGETTNMAADEAATSMAQLSNIMGLGADQAAKMGSAIVDLGNHGASTERDIVQMALRIAGAGRTVDMTAAQVLGIASALSSVGIEAEAGGSAISRVMIQIDKDVSTGADTLATYAQVSGMSVDQFSKAWKKDAAGALTSFITGLGNLKKSGGDVNGTLDKLNFTEIRVTDALRRAALAGDLLTDSIKTGTQAWDDNVALTEEANKRYQTTEARLQIARNRLNDVAIDIGGNLLPMIADAGDDVASLAEGFGGLPEPVKEWATKLGVAAFALSGLVGGAAIVIPKLNELKNTIDTLRGGSSVLGKALGGTANVLTGPWGLAIAGAVMVLGFWAKAQGDAKREAEEMIDTLDDQTGAITDQTRAKVLDNLQSDGIADKAKKLGLSLRELVDAAIDPTSDSYQRLKAQSEQAHQQLAALGQIGPGNAGAAKEITDANEDLWAVLNALDGQAKLVDDSQNSLQERIAAGVTPTEDLAQAQTIYNDVLRDGNQLAEDGAEAIDQLTRALQDLNQPALDAEAAESAYQAALDGVGEALEQQIEDLARQYEASGMSEKAARARAEAEVAAADKLDLGTEAGRRNREALREIAEAGIKRANALLEQTGDEELFRQSLDQSRQALHDAAIGFGMTEDAAWAYVDSVLAVPSEAAVAATFDAVTAEKNMQAFVNRWSGYNVPINLDWSADKVLAKLQEVQRRAGAYVMQAEGGVVEYYAGGGIREQHIAQIAPAGAERRWAEQETGGEGYIPLANDWRRPRAEAVLGDIARRFGGTFTKADQIAPPGVVVQSTGIDPSVLAGALNGLAFTLVTEAGPIRAIARAEVAGAQRSRTAALTQGVR